MQELTRENFRRLLREYLSSGYSLPQAYNRVIRAYVRDANIKAMDDMVSNLKWIYQVPAEDAINIASSAIIENNYIPYRDALNKYSANINRVNAIRGRSNTPIEQDQNTSESVNANTGKLGLPISGMYDESAVKPETDEMPSGNIVVGSDPEEKVKTPPTVASAIRLRRSPKPSDNPPVDVSIKPKSIPTSTPASKVIPKPKPVPKPAPVQITPSPTPVSTPTPPVAAPTLSSVVPQAIRHNGGFDNYRGESALAALRAAGGISPAEAVQRGIIPMEALNYI